MIKAGSKTAGRARAKAVAPKGAVAGAEGEPVVLTIGHSNRPLGEFLELLRAHGVTRLIDIRTVPRSRANPQFGRERLPASLKEAGIGYEHWAALGGLRRTSAGSPNKGWRNLSFRGYADHMQTAEFRGAVEELIRQAGRERIVLMCAEAVPWRCHRSLVADALLVRGIKCEDIRTTTKRMPHRLTPFARVRGTRITYPAQEVQTAPGKINPLSPRALRPEGRPSYRRCPGETS